MSVTRSACMVVPIDGTNQKWGVRVELDQAFDNAEGYAYAERRMRENLAKAAGEELAAKAVMTLHPPVEAA